MNKIKKESVFFFMPLEILVTTVLVFFVLPFIFAMIAYLSKDSSLSFMLTNGIGANLFFEILSFVTLMFLLILWKSLYKDKLFQIGFSSNKWLKKFAIGLLVGIFSICAVYGIMLLLGNASIKTVNFNYLFTKNCILYFILFIFVGFTEEILSRGFWMYFLKRTNNVFAIVLISSLCFAFMHISNDNESLIGIINVFLFAIFQAVSVIKTGSLWFAIGNHITWNFFEGNILGFAVSGANTGNMIQNTFSGSDLLTGGSCGAEGSLICLVLELALVLIMIFKVKKDNGENLWSIK